MMYIAWSSIEEMFYCFSGSSITLKGHRRQNSADFDPNLAFLDCHSSLNSPMATKWYTRREVDKKRCPIVFQSHTSNFKAARDKNRQSWSELGISELLLQFAFIDGYKMMHKAWSSIKEVPYFFKVICQISRSRGTKKSPILIQIRRFPTPTPAWIQRWLRNDAHSLEYDRRGAMLLFKVVCQILRSHGTKKLTWTGLFRTVIPVWIHRWLRNDAQNWYTLHFLAASMQYTDLASWGVAAVIVSFLCGQIYFTQSSCTLFLSARQRELSINSALWLNIIRAFVTISSSWCTALMSL